MFSRVELKDYLVYGEFLEFRDKKQQRNMSTEFIWPIRVYYEDTDAGGVVYYANYLKFYERARSEWLNHLNIDQPALLQQNLAFVVAKVEIDYLRPARLNDSLLVKSKIKRLSAAGIIFEQHLELQQADNNILLNKAMVKVACLNLDSFTPCRIPASVREEFQRAC